MEMLKIFCFWKYHQSEFRVFRPKFSGARTASFPETTSESGWGQAGGIKPPPPPRKRLRVNALSGSSRLRVATSSYGGPPPSVPQVPAAVPHPAEGHPTGPPRPEAGRSRITGAYRPCLRARWMEDVHTCGRPAEASGGWGGGEARGQGVA